MGSEQSSEKKSPAATPRDVERALEKQRKMYEFKMKQLLEESKRAATTKQTSQTSPINSVHTTAGPQPQPVPPVKPTKSSTPSHPPVPSTNTTQGTATYSQDASTVTICMDRQRNPYNYNQNDLHGNMNAGSLYPTLQPDLSTPHQANTISPMHSTPYNYSGSSNNFNSNNNFFNKTQQIPQSAQRYVPRPSAPPSEACSSRSRSQSRQRGFEGHLNCGTCGKMYGEKIYQCNQGHSSCNLCKMRQVQCGKCTDQITNRRNFDLEKYVMESKVQCPNASDGCRLYIKMADMAIHEKECPFKVLQCPSLNYRCTWSGKLSQLADHFEEMHPRHNQGEVDKEMFISDIINASHTMHYIRIGTFNFLFHVKIEESDHRIYFAAQLIGTKYSAAKWEYEIHMYKKNEPRKKFKFTDVCTSSNEPIQDIVNSAACAVIPQEYAMTFICGGSITYKFYIKRNDDKIQDSVASNASGEKVHGSRTRRHNFKKYVKKNYAVS